MITSFLFLNCPKYITYSFKRTVSCGGVKPLWCCRNVRKENHKCVYALCNCCKTSDMHIEINTSGTRTGRSRNRNPDYDLSNCSHVYHELHPFIDTQYLDPEYVKRKIAEKSHITN